VLHRVGRSIRLEHLGVHDQAVAVLYQKIPVVAQLGFFTLALAGQLRIRIDLRFMRLVGPPFSVKVNRGVPRIAWCARGFKLYTLA